MFFFGSPLQKALKIIRNTLFFLSLLVGLALFGLWLFEKKWGTFAVEQSIARINQELAVPIATSGIEFSFFANFPHASLCLYDVVIPSVHPEVFGKGDTLLVAKSVFLELNPFELLKGQTHIESFRLVQGYLNLKHNKGGVRNYDLLKPSTPSDSTKGKTPLLLEIQKLRLKQMIVSFADISALLDVKALIPNLDAKFAIRNGNTYLRVRADGLVETARQGDFIYAQKQYFALKSRLQIVNKRLETEGTDLLLDRNHFNVKGFWDLAHNQTQWDIKGENLDIRTLLAFASQYKWQLPPQINLKGALNAHLTLASLPNPKDNSLQIAMAIYGKDLTLKVDDQAYDLLNFQASFNNGSSATRRTTVFEISQCQLRRKNSNLLANFRLQNFDSPQLEAQLDFSFIDNEVHLPFLQPYLESYSTLRGNGALAVSFPSMDAISLKTLQNPRLRLDLDLDIDRLRPNPHQEFTNLHGAITINDQDLVKGALQGKWNKSDFEIGLNALNFLSIFQAHSQPQWTLNARLSNYDIPDNGIPIWNPEPTLNVSTPSDSIPTPNMWDILGQLKGDLEIYKSHYRGADIDSLQAHFVAAHDKVQINLSKAHLFGGSLHGDLALRYASAEDILLRANLYPERINLKELFLRYNNFGLKNFGHKNISGRLSGAISVHIPFITTTPNLADLQMRAQLAVYSGELIELNGLESLATFIKLEDLKHIRFSTLENEISIANQKISIPLMQIRSSALALRLQGEQHFNSHFQYRVQLSLSDLLFHRLRSKSRNLDDEIYEEDSQKGGGGALYLLLEGDSTHVNVSFDRKALAQRYQQRVQQEKDELKNLFNDEFNLSPKNAKDAHDAKKNSDPNKRYSIEWEESDSIKPHPSKNPPKKQPTTQPNTTPPAVVWEDE